MSCHVAVPWAQTYRRINLSMCFSCYTTVIRKKTVVKMPQIQNHCNLMYATMKTLTEGGVKLWLWLIHSIFTPFVHSSMKTTKNSQRGEPVLPGRNMNIQSGPSRRFSRGVHACDVKFISWNCKKKIIFMHIESQPWYIKPYLVYISSWTILQFIYLCAAA